MGFSFRVFIIFDSGEIHPITQKRFEQFHSRINKAAFPELAGQTIKMAVFYGQSKRKALFAIDREEYTLVEIDEYGLPSEEQSWRNMRSATDQTLQFLDDNTECDGEQKELRTNSDIKEWNPDTKLKKQLRTLAFGAK